MIRLMLLLERRGGWKVEVLSLRDGTFPNPMEAELYVFSGEGGEARLRLWNGETFHVQRDDVEAICGWSEGPNAAET